MSDHESQIVYQCFYIIFTIQNKKFKRKKGTIKKIAFILSFWLLKNFICNCHNSNKIQEIYKWNSHSNTHCWLHTTCSRYGVFLGSQRRKFLNEPAIELMLLLLCIEECVGFGLFFCWSQHNLNLHSTLFLFVWHHGFQRKIMSFINVFLYC